MARNRNEEENKRSSGSRSSRPQVRGAVGPDKIDEKSRLFADLDRDDLRLTLKKAGKKQASTETMRDPVKKMGSIYPGLRWFLTVGMGCLATGVVLTLFAFPGLTSFMFFGRPQSWAAELSSTASVISFLVWAVVLLAIMYFAESRYRAAKIRSILVNNYSVDYDSRSMPFYRETGGNARAGGGRRSRTTEGL